MSDTVPQIDHTVRFSYALHELLERFSADKNIPTSHFNLLAVAERISR